ncbi:hypothetical protein OSTOST_08067, partial [Ostertagia ostertagi]
VIDYVVKVAAYLPKARIGIVLGSRPPQTILDMGTYSEAEIRNKVTAPTEPLKEKETAQVLELGKRLLEGETRKHKIILIMSDGRESTYYQKDKPNDDETSIAELVR